jgi:hypothetical protein
VLDILETINSSSITPKKTAKASEISAEAFVGEASKQQFVTEIGPSEPSKVKHLEAEKAKSTEATLEAEQTKITEQILVEEIDTATPKHLPKCTTILFDMLRERNYPKKRSLKLTIMPEN